MYAAEGWWSHDDTAKAASSEENVSLQHTRDLVSHTAKYIDEGELLLKSKKRNNRRATGKESGDKDDAEEISKMMEVPDFYKGGWEAAGVTFEWFAKVVLDAYATVSVNRVLAKRDAHSVILGGDKLSPSEETELSKGFNRFATAMMDRSIEVKAPEDVITIVHLTSLDKGSVPPEMKLKLVELAGEVVSTALSKEKMAELSPVEQGQSVVKAFKRVLAVAPVIAGSTSATDTLVDKLLGTADEAVVLLKDLRALKAKNEQDEAIASTVTDLENMLGGLTSDLFIPSALGDVDEQQDSQDHHRHRRGGRGGANNAGATGKQPNEQRLKGCCAMLMGVFPQNEALATLRRVATRLGTEAVKRNTTNSSPQQKLVDLLAAEGTPDSDSSPVSIFLADPVTFFLCLFKKWAPTNTEELNAPPTADRRMTSFPTAEKDAVSPMEIFFKRTHRLFYNAAKHLAPLREPFSGIGGIPDLLKECFAVALALHASRHAGAAELFMFMQCLRTNKVAYSSASQEHKSFLTEVMCGNAVVGSSVSRYLLQFVEAHEAWHLLPFFNHMYAWMGDTSSLCNAESQKESGKFMFFTQQKNWLTSLALTEMPCAYFARYPASKSRPSMGEQSALTEYAPKDAKLFFDNAIVQGGPTKELFVNVAKAAATLYFDGLNTNIGERTATRPSSDSIDLCLRFVVGSLRASTLQKDAAFTTELHNALASKISAASHRIAIDKLLATPPTTSSNDAVIKGFVDLVWAMDFASIATPVQDNLLGPIKAHHDKIPHGVQEKFKTQVQAFMDEDAGSNKKKFITSLEKRVCDLAIKLEKSTKSHEQFVRECSNALVMRASLSTADALSAAKALGVLCSTLWQDHLPAPPGGATEKLDHQRHNLGVQLLSPHLCFIPTASLMEQVFCKAADALMLGTPSTAHSLGLFVQRVMVDIVKRWRLEENFGHLVKFVEERDHEKEKQQHESSPDSKSSPPKLLSTALPRGDMGKWFTTLCDAICSALDRKSDVGDEIALALKGMWGSEFLLLWKKTAKIIAGAESVRRRSVGKDQSADGSVLMKLRNVGKDAGREATEIHDVWKSRDRDRDRHGGRGRHGRSRSPKRKRSPTPPRRDDRKDRHDRDRGDRERGRARHEDKDRRDTKERDRDAKRDDRKDRDRKDDRREDRGNAKDNDRHRNERDDRDRRDDKRREENRDNRDGDKHNRRQREHSRDRNKDRDRQHDRRERENDRDRDARRENDRDRPKENDRRDDRQNRRGDRSEDKRNENRQNDRNDKDRRDDRHGDKERRDNNNNNNNNNNNQRRGDDRRDERKDSRQEIRRNDEPRRDGGGDRDRQGQRDGGRHQDRRDDRNRDERNNRDDRGGRRDDNRRDDRRGHGGGGGGSHHHRRGGRR